jgi:hypothetical protein
MRQRFFFKVLMMGLAIGVALCAPSSTCRAKGATGSLTVKKSGYDLFGTTTGSNFGPLGHLEGVPLGTFKFPSGLRNVGNTDTIFRRTQDVTVSAPGGTGQTKLELLALQMKTPGEVDFMGHRDTYYVTLQPDLIPGVPLSTGKLNITFTDQDHGTATSVMDVFYAIREHTLTGQIVARGDLLLKNSGFDWGRIAPQGAVRLKGINDWLDGSDNRQDFWVEGLLTESHPGEGVHTVRTATVTTPEPSTWIMYLTAGLMVSAGVRWRQHRARRSGQG